MTDSKEKQEEAKKPRMEPYKRQHIDWKNLLLEDDDPLEDEEDERD